MEEKIILQTKPSIIPALVVWPTVGITAACIFFIAANMFKSLGIFTLIFTIPGILFLTLGLLRCLIELIKRELTTYTLTNKQIIREGGFPTQYKSKITLDKVKGVHTIKPLAGQIFNYATVVIETWTGIIQLPYTNNAEQWENAIQKHIG